MVQWNVSAPVSVAAVEPWESKLPSNAPHKLKLKRSTSGEKPQESQKRENPTIQSSRAERQSSIVHEAARTSRLIIFDWDDTLLPSFWLNKRGLSLDHASIVSDEDRTILSSIERRVCATLTLALTYGPVVIITNAEESWVELSSSKFLPAVSELIIAHDIWIISARSQFESVQNPTPLSWKLSAFEYVVASTFPVSELHAVVARGCSEPERTTVVATGQATPQESNVTPRQSASNDTLGEAKTTFFDPKAAGHELDKSIILTPRHILSFGDSELERWAVMMTGRLQTRSHWITKSFKFAERPEPYVLLQEHDLIVETMDSLIKYCEPLDLRIEWALENNNAASNDIS